MHKVVIERPRWSPGPNKMGRQANLPDELLPKVQGMRRPYNCRKAFTDLLGPLRRWLRSQLGRPWNDVYSEACAVIKPDSAIRLHIKTHLLQFVERYTFIHEGEVCILDPYAGKPRRIESQRFGWEVFYVHPVSGFLLAVKPQSRRQWRQDRISKKRETLRWLDSRSALKRINGIWFMCEFREIPIDTPFRAYDYVAGKSLGRGGLTKRDGAFHHCISKRQLSRRVLRRYGLTNVVNANEERPFQRAMAH